jgi:hypothetical protein
MRLMVSIAVGAKAYSLTERYGYGTPAPPIAGFATGTAKGVGE